VTRGRSRRRRCGAPSCKSRSNVEPEYAGRARRGSRTPRAARRSGKHGCCWYPSAARSVTSAGQELVDVDGGKSTRCEESAHG
jgi:hypothetical protein